MPAGLRGLMDFVGYAVGVSRKRRKAASQGINYRDVFYLLSYQESERREAALKATLAYRAKVAAAEARAADERRADARCLTVAAYAVMLAEC